MENNQSSFIIFKTTNGEVPTPDLRITPAPERIPGSRFVHNTV